MSVARQPKFTKNGKLRGGWPKTVRTPPATEHPTSLDIAWAAGLYEGEGSCRLQEGGTGNVRLGQKDPWILERLVRLFGGNIIRRVTVRGTDHYEWTTTGARARGFLMTIYVFMSPRRKEQIRRVLEGG